MLAESTPSLTPDAILVIGGLITILSIAYLVLGVSIQCRKLFGKQPPMHEQIEKLRGDIVQQQAHHEGEIERWMRDHEKEDAEEFQTLRGDIRTVEDDVKLFRAEVVKNGDTRKRDIEAKVENTRLELKSDITTLRHETTTQTTTLLTAISRLEGKMENR